MIILIMKIPYLSVRWGLFATKAVIIGISVVIAAILLLSVIPLAAGGLSIQPNTNDITWSYENRTL